LDHPLREDQFDLAAGDVAAEDGKRTARFAADLAASWGWP